MKKIIITLCTFFLIMCGHVLKDGQNILITKKGTYLISSLNWILIVDYKNGLLQYSIKNNNNENLMLINDDKISIYQKWGIYFDSSNNLWVQSVDIGGFVWIFSKNGKYKKIENLNNPDIKAKMPPAFRDFIQ